MQSPNTFHLNRCSKNKLRSGEFCKGFTLVEILVVIAIFTLLIGLGLFMSMEAYRGFSFHSEQDTVVSVLQKARSRAMANIDQTAWGVCYISPNYVIFKGSTCTVAGSDLIPANPSVTIAGLSGGIIFSQLAGTSTGGVITVTQNNRVSTTTINYEGTIIW